MLSWRRGGTQERGLPPSLRGGRPPPVSSSNTGRTRVQATYKSQKSCEVQSLYRCTSHTSCDGRVSPRPCYWKWVPASHRALVLATFLCSWKDGVCEVRQFTEASPSMGGLRSPILAMPQVMSKGMPKATGGPLLMSLDPPALLWEESLTGSTTRRASPSASTSSSSALHPATSETPAPVAPVAQLGDLAQRHTQCMPGPAKHPQLPQ